MAERLDEVRSWPTERVVAYRDDKVGEQRRARMEEMIAVRVLDERGRIDTAVGADGQSPRVWREKVETARALESLPNVAAAAHAGDLSDEQLGSVVKVADEESDAEWAARAPHVAPADLARMARTASKPTLADSQARYEARGLKMWWSRDKGMLHFRGQLPDRMGVRFEETIQRETDRMKPGKGRAWDTFEHRAADVLHGMCDAVDIAAQVEKPTLAPRPIFVVQVPQHGPAEIAGIPIADELLEQLRGNAIIEPVVVDDDGVPVAVGRRTSALSPKIARAVLLRDGHCRFENCEVRHGLEIHHLRPRSLGGTDDLSELAAVCTIAGHHQKLIPHGPWALVGNPNRPDGLRVVHVDDLTAEEAEQLGLPPPRAGPTAE